jgi:hypothetical protein
MRQHRYPAAETMRRASEIYERDLRARVEHDDNIGKFIAIDVDTGNYDIGPDLWSTGAEMIEKDPEVAVGVLKIGYNATISFGGGLQRRSDPILNTIVMETHP